MITLDAIHNTDETWTVVATDHTVGAIYSYGPLSDQGAADVLAFYGRIIAGVA